MITVTGIEIHIECVDKEREKQLCCHLADQLALMLDQGEGWISVTLKDEEDHCYTS